MVNDNNKNKALGAFLGMACGDALGATLEFMSRNKILSEYPDNLRDIVGGGYWSVRPGQITDDTEMGLAIARALVRVGEYHPYAVLYNYLTWFNSNPVDVGTTIRAVLNVAQSGFPAEIAAESYHHHSGGRSAGNGSLMRQAPLAVFYHDDMETLAKVTRIDTALTHYDPLARDASEFYTAAIATLINGGTIDDAVKLVEGKHELVQEAVNMPLDKIEEMISGRTMGFCITSLAVAWHALKTATSLEEGIIWAANLGGDTDTNGAIAGALLGAKFGASEIPTRWTDVLEPKDEINNLVDEMFSPVFNAIAS